MKGSPAKLQGKEKSKGNGALPSYIVIITEKQKENEHYHQTLSLSLADLSLLMAITKYGDHSLDKILMKAQLGAFIYRVFFNISPLNDSCFNFCPSNLCIFY